MADSNVMIRIGAHVSGAIGGIGRVYGALNNLTQKASNLAVVKFGGIVSLATAGLGITGLGVKVAKLGAHAETTRLAFQTMLGSVQKGDAMMAKLDRFSNSTPYSGDQVNQAAKTLLAFGVSAGNVEQELRKVGDVAAGSGKDFNELAAIYGKVFARGKADAEALNQMIGAGIPIIKLLGQQYGKSGDEIYAMASKGEISAKAISDAFAKMSGEGGTYAGMMAKQSETVSGLWGAITGQLEYAGSLIGETIAPIVKKILTYFQGWADELVAMSQDGRMVQYLSTVALTAIDMGAKIGWAFITLKEYGSAAFSVIGRVGRLAFNGLLGVGAEVFSSLVSTAVEATNAVIAALNRIPGIKIDAVKEPAFVGKIRQFAQDAGRQAAEDLNAILTGKDFKQAEKNIASAGGKIDAFARKASDAVTGWQSDALKTLAERKNAKLDDKGGSDLSDKSGKSDKGKPEKVATDSLTRIGLYGNFGGGEIKSIDRERNQILKDIRELLTGRRGTSGEVLT